MTKTSSNALATLSWCNLAAQSAEQISLAAVPIVAVMLLQAGPGEIGMLTTAQTLPFLLLSIPMGVLADRWSRSRLMVLAEGMRALSLLALLWVVSSGSLSFAVLAVLATAPPAPWDSASLLRRWYRNGAAAIAGARQCAA